MGSKNSRFSTINWDYNPLDWYGNTGWKTTSNSFPFSFEDGKNISTAKLGYVNNASCAVYCSDNQGPSMGNLVCYDHPNWKNVSGNNYPKIGIPETTFTIKEYEVFQVTEL